MSSNRRDTSHRLGSARRDSGIPTLQDREDVNLCIQGVTTTGHRGGTNPAGYPYHEGPCNDPTTTSTTALPRPPVAVKVRPQFTG